MPNIPLPMSVQAVGIVVRPYRAVPITKEVDEVTLVLSSDPPSEVLTDRCGTPSSLDAERVSLVQRPWVKDAKLAALTTILCLADRQ